MFAHDPPLADNSSAPTTPMVQDFIRRYDDTLAAADFDTLPSFFDEQVLVITPSSSRCMPRTDFVAAAEARARHMDSAPHAELIEQSTTELGGHCWLASAQWRLTLDGDRHLDLHSDFLIRRGDGDLRIAAYLTRQDLPQLMREAERRS
ncbi:nuclear transport factor 2 family protein [Nocardia sp. NPDC051321]|uniref:nuclear transport factor 2 family protein n=1 Tax=Nocardia sp. NPDC051321 TaxID=3364323 RepID=UPI00379CC938